MGNGERSTLEHTEHEGDGNETGILVAVDDELLKVALLLFSQHEAAGRGVCHGRAHSAASLFRRPAPHTPASSQPTLPRTLSPAASPIGSTQHHVEPEKTEQLPPQKFVDAAAPQQ